MPHERQEKNATDRKLLLPSIVLSIYSSCTVRSTATAFGFPLFCGKLERLLYEKWNIHCGNQYYCDAALHQYRPRGLRGCIYLHVIRSIAYKCTLYSTNGNKKSIPQGRCCMVVGF